MSTANKAPAFQFYAAEFLADENVALMSNQEIGCYIKLICFCWREGSIPSDIAKIARLCGEDSSAMALLWVSIKPCFGEADGSPDRLVHKRLQAEREKQLAFKAERSAAGKRGAESRWNKARQDDGSAIAKPLAKHASSSSSSSSSTIKNNMSGKPDAPTEIIEYLNGKTGRRFGFVKANLDLVKARLKEGATVETMKAVIDAKVKAWKGDPKMDEYLRPETLFGARKFAQYSGQLGGTGKVDWWRAAGFKNEWDAMNAGCTAVSAYLWRDGQKAEV